MQIVINIPKEFEEHFNSNKFEDSLQRVRFDIHKAIIAKKDVLLSGNYEIETLDMLTEAFLKGISLPKEHGRIVDENKITKCEQIGLIIKDDEVIRCFTTDAPTIIEANKK